MFKHGGLVHDNRVDGSTRIPECDSCHEPVTDFPRHVVMDENGNLFVFHVRCSTDILLNFLHEREAREEHLQSASQRFNSLFNQGKENK